MASYKAAHGLDRRAFLMSSAAVAAAMCSPQAMAAEKPLSDVIARFVTGLDLKTVPSLAIERTRTAFIDTVGVMLVGSQEKAAEIVHDIIKLEGAKPAAGIVGTSLRTSAQSAALANGVASHALDFDLTYVQGQLTASLVPALLPLAETTGASQAEMLAAYLAGFEVSSRLSRANPSHNAAGLWHATSTIGSIGAAVAAARLLKAPAAAIPDVVGISVSLASGVNANYGTMTKPLHAGHAASNGILAAMLGMRGFSSNPQAIEGRGGFAKTFARGLEWKQDAFNDLGKQYDIAVYGYQPKRYPCGGVIHTAIDAALILREKLGADVANIASIHAGIANYAADRAKPEYPTNTEAAKFNLQYVIGYSLVNGVPKLAAFDPPAINDPAVKAMAQKVTASIDPEFADARQNYPTRLRVTLKDGRVIEELRRAASGTAEFPLTQVQIEEKFMDCATHAVDKATADKILATLRTLGDQPSLDGLWPLLRKA
ncbi:MAG: MmgE/PrpD family protein [Pseudomonadota bacterium]